MEFRLSSEYIELDNLLKVLNIASSGAEAKILIQRGTVRVNGEPEARIRRKLKVGDVILVDAEEIKVV